MKTRNGFVSNSSTSSFVVIAVKTTPKIKKAILDADFIPKTDENGENISDQDRWTFFVDGCCYDQENELNIEYFNTAEADVSDEIIKSLIGVQIENGKTASDLAKIADKLKEFLKTKTEPAIYAWTDYNG